MPMPMLCGPNLTELGEQVSFAGQLLALWKGCPEGSKSVERKCLFVALKVKLKRNMMKYGKKRVFSFLFQLCVSLVPQALERKSRKATQKADQKFC